MNIDWNYSFKKCLEEEMEEIKRKKNDYIITTSTSPMDIASWIDFSYNNEDIEIDNEKFKIDWKSPHLKYLTDEINKIIWKEKKKEIKLPEELFVIK